MFYQTFRSPQVKRKTIISNKHGRQGKSAKSQTCQNYKLVPSLPVKMKIFLILANKS